MPALAQGPLPSAPSSKRRPMIRSAAEGSLMLRSPSIPYFFAIVALD
jgi:hypothetical protein